MFNLLWDIGARGHRAFQRPNQIVALFLLFFSFGLRLPASGQKVVRIEWDYFRAAVNGWMENGSRVPWVYMRKWEMELSRETSGLGQKGKDTVRVLRYGFGEHIGSGLILNRGAGMKGPVKSMNEKN